MPPDIERTIEGQRFLSQLYSFNGKFPGKHKFKDDAPDALICCMQASFEKGYQFYKNELTKLQEMYK